MIPDFKTYIKESLWTDIQDRSTGDTIRKEDDVNLLDCEGLYNYIKSNYELEDENCVRLGKGKDNITIDIIISKGIFSEAPVSIFIDFNDVPRKNREHNICVTLDPNDFPGDFLKEADDRYLIRKCVTNKSYISIYPKDDSEPTNIFLLRVLDFVISYLEVNGNIGLKIRKLKIRKKK